MHGVSPKRLRVFEITRMRDGRLEELTVDPPTAWARAHGRVEVELSPGESELGWHARLVGDGKTHLMRFPWHDHVDRILLGDRGGELPIDLDGGRWDDLEQGWWATVIPVGSFVYLAEGDFDELIDTVRESSVMQTVKPGVVLVDGTEVRWARVDRAAYDDAWRRIVARARETK